MISFTRLGTHGRLGNQLFQLAATLGIAERFKTSAIFPAWEYSEFFEGEIKIGVCNGTVVKERYFHYDDDLIQDTYSDVTQLSSARVDLFGYFQSYKYWSNCEPYIKNTLKFKKDFINEQRRKYYKAFEKKTIAIHVRRGDYIDNPNYECLPINYYILALFENFPNWREQNLIIFGDDMAYCKVHFDCLPNVFFSEGNSDIEDMCLMSQCDNFIISNSSFAWWASYIGDKKGTKVIRPKHYYKGELKKSCDTKDFWIKKWVEFDHVGKKINLSDTTFTIPVAYDHKDRQKNLDLCVCMLQHYFDTNIIIGEQGAEHFRYMKKYADYMTWPGMHIFHRTKMLNDMARHAKTPFIANWDADVTVAPLQLHESINALRAGAIMVYPYKWMFARIPRLPWFAKLEQTIDIGVVGDTKFNGMNNGDAISYGGAVLFRKKEFFKLGGENENFISFGPEDAERYTRFKTLGVKIERTNGPIYHINHYVGPNSSNRHAHVNSNRKEWEKIQTMHALEMVEYIKTWKWAYT